MFCNISTREIKRNFSKGNIWKNDMPLQFSHSIPILRYQFPNEMINKICDLSTFFFINHFMNSFTNSEINGSHSE